ncbi:MAG: YcfL family protein [Gammaproteobacteria bacterium]|nr:YcfL family protein [Gammaproteobacteria bacterium]
MKTRQTLIAAAVALCTSYGCTTSGIEARGEPDAGIKELVIHNDSLANSVTIQEMRSRRSGPLLQVSLLLANLSDSDLSLQYRFSWVDSDNFALEEESNHWIPITLHGRGSRALQGVAPTPKATSYRLNIRENP